MEKECGSHLIGVFLCYTVVMRYKVYDVQREVFPGLSCEALSMVEYNH